MPHLLVERAGPVTTLTLNREERRNALSLDSMLELMTELDSIGTDRETRVLILAASGKVFCSGHDLSELPDGDRLAYRRDTDSEKRPACWQGR